jgi:LacI family transcriptional regulator
VLEVAKRVNYSPRVSRRRFTIGLVIEDLEAAGEVGFVSNVVSALAKHMIGLGGVLELVPLDDPDYIVRNHISGLIAVVFNQGHALLRTVSHIPVVLMNIQIEGMQFHSVASDHAQGAYLAAQHLIERGHRRVGFMEVSAVNWGSRERQRGFKQAFIEAGLEPPVQLMRFCEPGPPRSALVPLLEEKPTALVACGEDLSLEVYRTLVHGLGYRIPDDLSLVTYEIPLVSESLTPPLTTIAQPWDELGRASVEAIKDMVAQRARDRTDVVLPNRLIKRGSVRRIE